MKERGAGMERQERDSRYRYLLSMVARPVQLCLLLHLVYLSTRRTS